MQLTLNLPTELENQLYTQAKATNLSPQQLVEDILNKILAHQLIIRQIQQLPVERVAELSQLLTYLQLNVRPTPAKVPGSPFLLSLVGLGETEETDLSARDEEILAQEIDPIRGWGLT